MSALEALRYQQGPPASLRLLDQRQLPFDAVYEDIQGPADAFSAIKVCAARYSQPRSPAIDQDSDALYLCHLQDMKVRGAPAIAIAAALALAVELRSGKLGLKSATAAAHHVEDRLQYLVTRYVNCLL